MEGRVTLSDRPNADAASISTHASELERDIERVLLSEAEIQATLQRLGEEITADYAGRDVLLIGVLKGAFVVMADLARYIRLPVEFDFMAVGSHGAAPPNPRGGPGPQDPPHHPA